MSQTGDQEQISKEANKYFKNKEFLVAEKFYAQLVSLYPENGEYNYKYGACLLNNSGKKTDALKYLKFAVDHSAENDAHYYLGKAYQVCFQFKEAIAEFNVFKSAAKTAQIIAFDIDLLIKECETSLTLLNDFNEVRVLNSKVMKRNQFFRAYKLDGLDRKVLIKPIEFYTKEDQKNLGLDPMLIVNGESQQTLVFSGNRYGGKFGVLDRNIYLIRKASDGTWSDFEDVGPFINTDFDEDFPFLHPNGKILYFSSKGYGGLGGYDIYKSHLDTLTNLWGKPLNLGFAVNSPFDDILYVTDELEKVAYFSSNRDNQADEVTVYKIAPEKFQDKYVLCKGEVKVVGGGANSNKAIVSVFNSRNQLIANYSSDIKTGSFLFPLAELENYTLEIAYSDSIKQRLKLSIPSKSVKEVVFIKFLFQIAPKRNLSFQFVNDYELTDNDKKSVFNELSKLTVNQKVDNIAFGSKTSSIDTSGLGFNNASDIKSDFLNAAKLSTAQLLTIAKNDLDQIVTKKGQLAKEINSVYLLAESKQERFEVLKKELAALNLTKNSTSPEVLAQIDKKQKEFDNNLNELKGSLIYASSLESQYKLKVDEERIIRGYVMTLEMTISANNSKSSIERLKNYQIKTKQEYDKLKSKEERGDQSANLDEELIALKVERSDLETSVYDINSSIELMSDAITILTKEMTNTKSKSRETQLASEVNTFEKNRTNKKVELLAAQELLDKSKFELSQKGMMLNVSSIVQTQNSENTKGLISTNDRERIINQAKLKVTDGSLDEISAIREDFDFSKITTEIETAEANSEKLNKDTTQTINDVVLSIASKSEIDKLSAQYLEIPASVASSSDNSVLAEREKKKENLLRDALRIRQEIETKKTELQNAKTPEEKQRLNNEIEALEEQLLQKESEVIDFMEESNVIRYSENAKKLDAAILANGNSISAENKANARELKDTWESIKIVQNEKNTSTVVSEKVKIGKEILNAQVEVIKEQVKIAELIRNPQAKVDGDSPIAFADDSENDNGNNTENETEIDKQEDPSTPKQKPKKKNNTPNKKKDVKKEVVDEEGISFDGSKPIIAEGLQLDMSIRYDENTVVPIDVDLEDGLLYKVQVGAFRKKINPAIFDGMAPLMGESTKNGYIRYTAGLFKSFKAANMAKGRIRSMGYSDAFVVVFYKGKRISNEEAEKIRKKFSPENQIKYEENTTKEVNALLKAGIKEAEAYSNVVTKPNPIDVYAKSQKGQNNQNNNLGNENPTNGDASETTLNSISGIYYTVQIGVFNVLKTSEELFNISPIINFKAADGTNRYSTGVYSNLNDATQRKAEIVALGVVDAYVVAYKDGVRITVQEAQALKSK